MPQFASKQLWIVIGDIHEDTDNMEKIPELSTADGIIVTGDLTNCGNAETAKRIMDTLKKTGLPVLAQIGNMDLAEVNTWLEETGQNLHVHTHAIAPDLVLFGIGGSNITPFQTPSEFEEKTYADWLKDLWKEASKFPHQILVSHCPPKNTVCDQIGEMHVGSDAVREFIEKQQPDLCLCGHIHEARGTDKIGKTLVINPGRLADGGYVLLSHENGQLKASLSQVRS